MARFPLALAGIVAVALSAPAFAASDTTGAGKTRPFDKTFVTEAATGGHAEVKLGKLASEKTAYGAVKRFAQRMVDDHGKANAKLKRIAQNSNIDVPAGVDKAAQKTYDRLTRLSDGEFDRTYMNVMVQDHRKTVDLFKKELSQGKIPALQKFAEETLPTLEDHLKEAESIRRALKEKSS